MFQLTDGYPNSYTYEVCMFGEARQIPNNGGTTFSLGSVHRSVASVFALKPIFVENSILGTHRRMSILESPRITKNKCTSMERDVGMVQSGTSW